MGGAEQTALDAALEESLRGLSSQRLMTHVTEFARWTKHAGTPEEMESLQYVRDEIASYGYRTELLLHDAYISLPGPARVEALGRVLRCNTHSFSRPSPAAGVEAEVVYVGAGDAAGYGGLDVRGKIVLVDGIASPGSTITAGTRGAVGQIHVSPHEHLHEMCISPVWGSPGDDDLERLPDTVVVTVPLAEGEELKAECERQTVVVTIHAEVDTGWRMTPILVAELGSEGGEQDEPFVLFTGHHDTWYRGVMDNGGANATMLEVARVCGQLRSKWQRGLRLIFWSGHSQGRYSSSAWYADTHWEELEVRAVVHVNVDSTGGAGNTIVADTTAAAELAGLAHEALASQAGQEFSGRRMSRAGDQSFWGIGVPSIYGNMSEQPARPGEANASAAVFGGGARKGAGTGWWWHTPEDTLDKIDAQILLRDTRIYQHTVWRLLTSPVLPLDYGAAARELIETLEERQRQAEGVLDLSLCIERARELERRAASLGELHADPAELGAVLHRLSRVVVPISYTLGDRFVHDPALAQPPLPALADTARLAFLPLDGDERRFLVSRLQRAANHTARALREALAVIDGIGTR
jgi:N-acetylated-alpha-linked acidic dipeptidase